MSTLTFDPRPTAMPRAARSRRARTAAGLAQRDWLKSMALERGEIVRVRDGRGLVLRANAGTVWVTEEGEAGDVVLVPGGAHRIASNGVTLIEAQRDARIEVEAVVGTLARRSIERVPRPAPTPKAASGEFRLRLAGLLAAVAAWFAPGSNRPREPDPVDVPVGGWESHDKAISSRRPRGDRVAPEAYARPSRLYPFY